MTDEYRDNQNTTKILIVEDHPIFRMGLADLIEQEADLMVCGHAKDASAGQIKIAELHPDLVIVDLALGSSNGLDLVSTIKAEFAELPVLVLSTYDEKIYAERCLYAGARGYVNKKEASDLVINAIRHILEGNIFLSQSMTDSILNKFHDKSHNSNDTPVKKLSNRELEVFTLIGNGMVPGAIAKHLHISSKTVYSHTERIKEKLNIKHSSELVRFAVLWVEREE